MPAKPKVDKAASKPIRKVTKSSGGGRESLPKKILVIDIGGSKIKVLATGQTEPRKALTNPDFTPSKMVQAVLKLAKDCEYQAISIGYPGQVGDHGPSSEPGNLGPGWVGFDFPAAFGKPVRIINDAAMQALGSYEGGRMLFLGLGTGLGSTLIAENVIIPLEIGQLRYDRKTSFVDVVGEPGRQRLGKKKWRSAVVEIASLIAGAMLTDDVVIGGGNAKQLGALPHGMRVGSNQTAFRGGFRLWHLEDIRTHSEKDGHRPSEALEQAGEWRMI